MEITHIYAQSIAEKTSKILNRNINIMNRFGIIVGSSDKKRINTYHQAAAEIIKTGEPMEITTKQANGLKGVKPGINLPIILNEKIVGVVGITGEPEEVRPFGQLLKISVETMLIQIYLAKQFQMEQNAKELYISDILNGNFQESIEMFLIKGEVLGYNMSLPRIAVVIKIYGLYDVNRNKLKAETKFEHVERKRRERILSYIKEVFNNPQNMISYNGSNTYVVLFAIKRDNIEIVKEEIKEILMVFQKKIGKDSISYCVGVGSYYPKLAGLRKSYKEAIKAIQISNKITDNKSPQLVFASDMFLEMMLTNTPVETLRVYKSQILTRDGAEGFLTDSKLIKTLKTFLLSNMNISETSEKLKVNRNTVSNRLKKINWLTGLNPCDFNDAVKLKILVTAIDMKSI